MNNNLALHAAIAKFDKQNFDRLLRYPDIDINFKNDEGNTPLLASIKKDFGSSMAMSLIEAGCNVNCRDRFGVTPLHNAIINDFINVAHALILRGADINKKTGTCGDSPLTCAILHGNLEAVCLLLYYQVDVNISAGFAGTHLSHAVRKHQNNIYAMLIDYCDISFENVARETAVSVAVYNENPIAIDLLNRGATVSSIDHWGHTATPSHCATDLDSPLHRAAQHENNKLFKVIWPRLDCIPFKSMVRFMFWYINESSESKFSKSEWWECLHLMLNRLLTLYIHDIQNYNKKSSNQSYIRSNRIFRPRSQKRRVVGIFWNLMLKFFYMRKELNDRLSLIYIWLSLGGEIKPDDLQFIHLLFGSNNEFEAIAYMGNISYEDYKNQINLLFKEPFNSAIPDVIYHEFVTCYRNNPLPQNPLCSLGYFSLLTEKKIRYLVWIRRNMPRKLTQISRRISTIPQFPLLLELSRNQQQKSIEENGNFVKAYQFYDVVKGLDLPQIMKDMILFKRPIY